MNRPETVPRLARNLICPRCQEPLVSSDDSALRCDAERIVYRCINGIWRFLHPADADDARRFVDQYRAVRLREGWGAEDGAYYRTLPFADRSGRHRDIWEIRARSYRAFLRHVLAGSPRGGRCAILDLGAGNCWLSARLADRGHDVAAIDVNLDRRDGLGAHQHYDGPPFLVVQAAFDRLPWPDELVDMVVYNGSLHYSGDYAVTLNEARRVLRPCGEIVILDTPFYRRAESGKTMVRERDERIRGTHDNAEVIANEGFLTRSRLARLGEELGIEWRITTPWYGLRWGLRPLLNRLRGHREPARFHLVRGRIKDP